MADWDPFADPADVAETESPAVTAAPAAAEKAPAAAETPAETPEIAGAEVDSRQPLPTERFGGQFAFPLRTGGLLPAVGLGTWKIPPDASKGVALKAIQLGYRHFDCARPYGNEKVLGEAFKEAIDKGLTKREELFITTKLWSSNHGTAKVPIGLNMSLKALNCGYIDLFLIHLPDIAAAAAMGGVCPPLEETWAAMEKLVDEGKCRAIGVSNFSIRQLERILKVARIAPAVNEVELHPYLPQQALLDFCKVQNILPLAYSPLGCSDGVGMLPYSHAGDQLLKDSTVASVASSSGRSPAQVILRWALHRGYAVIPKSRNPGRLAENIDLFSWELTAAEFQSVSDITRRERCLKMADCCGEKFPCKSPVDIFDDTEGLEGA